ncbi:DUF4153 domain-containing protein [Thioclava sp. F36-7]|uniref:DUF4153 domain-containing protein n=1 Tax=Thioclava sp. F36-7 TaxID=1915317 RepID=UPI0009974C25|nr:DUF4153 domain-containing protein [Thioclava sp. F36-7]OOY09926.1 hypothetical protein BMI89_03720 [Thioclava sp. F36-7]
MQLRLQHILLGLLAGMFFWALDNQLQQRLPIDAHGQFGVSVLGTVFFATALAMLGEIGWRRAFGAAALIAVPVALLGWWASLGYAPSETLAGYMPYELLALSVLAMLPMPFAMAVAQGGGRAWNDYPALFLHAWNIVVRYAAACIFLGMVWLVLYLSARLLESVDLDFLRQLLREKLFAFAVSGGILGLGLAVVTELEEMISPTLILRLLRLLLPPVLLVAVIFVAGFIARRGEVSLIGFSQIETLLAMAAAAVTLISIGIERDDESAVRARVLRLSAQGLALVLPVLVGAAAWTGWQSVTAQGWTPGRVAQAVLIVLLAGYALGYAGSVLLGRGWMVRLRRINIAMAGVLLLAALAWLTPVLDANGVAARSQLALYREGRITAGALPLYALKNHWGLAGQAAVAELETQAGDDRALATALARLSPSADGAEGASAARAQLRRDLVLPPGAKAPEDALLDAIRARAPEVAAGLCASAEGAAANCALIEADFLSDVPGDEAMVLLHLPDRDAIYVLRQSNGAWDSIGWGSVVDAQGEPRFRVDLAPVIAAIKRGEMQLAPSGIMALEAGGLRLLPLSR